MRPFFFRAAVSRLTCWNQFQAQQLLEDATDRASTAFHGVPRIAVTIGIIILALWLISFGRNLLRYGRFKMRFGSEFISVHTGIITGGGIISGTPPSSFPTCGRTW